MENVHRRFSPQEKVALPKLHLIEKKSVADLCDEYHLPPTVFYRSLKAFSENDAFAFQADSTARRPQREQQLRSVELEAIVRDRNEILAQVLQENFDLKARLARTASNDRPLCLENSRPEGGT